VPIGPWLGGGSADGFACDRDAVAVLGYGSLERSQGASGSLRRGGLGKGINGDRSVYTVLYVLVFVMWWLDLFVMWVPMCGTSCRSSGHDRRDGHWRPYLQVPQPVCVLRQQFLSRNDTWRNLL